MVTFRVKQVIKLDKSCKNMSLPKIRINKPALVGKAGSITNSIKLINGLKKIKKGDSVLIKPNINSDDNYPGTTRAEGLRELIKLLKNKGAEITVGDMSSAFWSHTRVCAKDVGLTRVCEDEGVPLIYFEEGKWVKIKLGKTSLGDAWFTDELCQHDHLINLAVLKTHRLADFTLSMKNLMGLLHMRTRMKMHASKLKQRIGEFNKAVNPLLNIIDGTECFIDGGPDKGDLRSPGIVFASKDRVALDVVCVKELQSLGSKSLKGVNPWKHPQIKYAVKHGVGVNSDDEIKVKT